MLDFFKSLFRAPAPSGETAKERLRLVLLSDHLSLAPDVVESLKRDLMEVISRYVEIDSAHADVTFEHREREIAMLASIPITGVRERKAPQATVLPPPPASPEPRATVAQPEPPSEATPAEPAATAAALEPEAELELPIAAPKPKPKVKPAATATPSAAATPEAQAPVRASNAAAPRRRRRKKYAAAAAAAKRAAQQQPSLGNQASAQG
jgi:cell division topological specificity factor